MYKNLPTPEISPILWVHTYKFLLYYGYIHINSHTQTTVYQCDWTFSKNDLDTSFVGTGLMGGGRKQ